MDSVTEIAMEFAETFPFYMQKKLNLTDDITLEQVETATKAAVNGLFYAGFMMLAEHKGADHAHTWFMETLNELAKKLEESLPEIGIRAQFDIRGISMHQMPDESGDWR